MKKIACVCFFMIVGVSGMSVRAQSNLCDLRINSYELMPGSRGRPVGDARGTAKNALTGITFSSKSIGRTVYFSSLKEGTYRVFITRTGWKPASETVTLDCKQADSQNILCWDIELIREPSFQRSGDGEREFAIVNVAVGTGSDTDYARQQTCQYPLPRPTMPRIFVTRTILGGVMNQRAISLPRPAYPAEAKDVNVSGVVTVQVLVDERGFVTSAVAVSGHRLLRKSAENAARLAKFAPITIENVPMKVKGILYYNFVPE